MLIKRIQAQYEYRSTLIGGLKKHSTDPNQHTPHSGPIHIRYRQGGNGVPTKQYRHGCHELHGGGLL